MFHVKIYITAISKVGFKNSTKLKTISTWLPHTFVSIRPPGCFIADQCVFNCLNIKLTANDYSCAY